MVILTIYLPVISHRLHLTSSRNVHDNILNTDSQFVHIIIYFLVNSLSFYSIPVHYVVRGLIKAVFVVVNQTVHSFLFFRVVVAVDRQFQRAAISVSQVELNKKTPLLSNARQHEHFLPSPGFARLEKRRWRHIESKGRRLGFSRRAKSGETLLLSNPHEHFLHLGQPRTNMAAHRTRRQPHARWSRKNRGL